MIPAEDGAGALRLDAPAKVNLDLRVIGRRDDGFHLLESHVALLELADRLLLLPGCSGLRVDGPTAAGVPLDAANLGWRGLVAALGSPPELVCLTLEKRIPSAAGLGGGSSDAAAGWRLGRAWVAAPDQPTDDELAGLARIGADVPFFAAGVAAALVEGVGERVTPRPPQALEIVLVHPPFRLATGDVFGALRSAEWGSGANDLLAPARRLCPQIGDVFDAVVAAGGEPRLTGSGPTVFAATDDADHARDLAGRLERRGLAVTVTRTRGGAASIEHSEEDDD